MIIKQMHLKNFRNYEDCSVIFDEKMNIIHGDNAQGKTNILEAIYVCATSKSHRTNYFKEMIQMGLDSAHITLDIEKEGEPYTIDVHFRKSNKKNIAINKLPVKKIDELLGVLHVIMFSPEDLSLIKSGPKERRRFIDIELSQLDGVYYKYLHQYHHLLKQRNALLKECQKNYSKSLKDQLDIWNIQFIEMGSKVIHYREKFITDLNIIYQKRHYDISGNQEKMNLVYEKNTSIEEFEKKISASTQRDIRFGSTTVGPHRDDLLFELDGVDLRKYGSQGQQRTAALSLKLSEIDLVVQQNNIRPILLLDDVLSELDGHRQIYLMNHLSDIQTFITCTGVEDFIRKNNHHKRFFHIKSGEIA
jgi:DNA replication and repair protein RecF